MTEDNSNRDQWLHVRITEQEKASIMAQFKATTEPKLSAYVRKIVLGKPMIKTVRDVGLAELLGIIVKCQKDLNGLANNFNQAIKKLHTYKDDPGIQAAVLTLKMDEKAVMKAIEELRLLVDKTQEKWLQG